MQKINNYKKVHLGVHKKGGVKKLITFFKDLAKKDDCHTLKGYTQWHSATRVFFVF
jgi:hypothetical protein